jgi:two-component system chemotaxis response regulator CheB
MAKRDIFVVGGSAGSGRALKELVGALPADFPGSVFITTHLPSEHRSYLPELLAGAGPLPVAAAIDGQPVEPGRIYVAARDRHLLLLDPVMRLGAGPRENMVRPAIDPMFRSAALTYGPRTVGVVLSGRLNDGAAGLSAIKQAGGTTVAQHPVDAEVDEMPRAALEAAAVEHVVRAADLGELMRELARTEAGPAVPTPDSLLFEVEVAAGARLGSDLLRRFAQPVALTCPDCAGVLSEVRGAHPLRYRCQIGHAFTADHLAAQSARVDEAVRLAMRIMEERVELVSRMARDARETGRMAVAELYDARAEEYRRYAATLRDAAILSLRAGPEDDDEAPG